MSTPPTPTPPPVGFATTTTRIATQCPRTGTWYTVESSVTVPIGADEAEMITAMNTTARVQARQDALLQSVLDAYLNGPPEADDAPTPATTNATDAPARVPAANPAAAPTPPAAPPIPPDEVRVHVGRCAGWKLGTCSDAVITTISQGAWPTFGQDARDEPLKRAALQLLHERAVDAAREKHPLAAAAPTGRSAASAPPRPAAPSSAPHRAENRQPVRPPVTGRRA